MADSIWRCAYKSTVQSVDVVNTWHIVYHDVAEEFGADAADAIRDALDTALTTKYRAILGSDMTLQTLTVRQELEAGSVEIPAESTKTIGLAGTGGIGPPRAPLELCQVVAFKSNVAVRGSQGRMFVPISDTGTLTSTGLFVTSGAWNTAMNAFLDELKTTHAVTAGALGTHNTNQVVYSRTRRGRGAPTWWFTVTAYVRRAAPRWLESRQTAP